MLPLIQSGQNVTLFYFLLKVQLLKTIVGVIYLFIYFFVIVDFGIFMPDWLTVDNDLHMKKKKPTQLHII